MKNLAVTKMPTYTSYHHVELDRIGMGKKRVLKPPGGGSSIMFGDDDEFSKKTSTTTTPTPTATPASESTKENVPSNTESSSTPATETTQSPQKPPTTNGTNGEVKSEGSPSSTPSNNSSPNTPSLKDPDTKTRLFGDDTTNLPPRENSATPRRVKDHMKSNIFAADETNGTVTNGTSSPASVSKQNSTESTTSAADKPLEPPQPRGRIPPGGFSTKLW